MKKDKPMNKVLTWSRANRKASRKLDTLTRNLPGRRAMIEDIIRRNRACANTPGVQLYGGTATDRECWVEWYDDDLVKARKVAALDARLTDPPLASETPRESYRGLEQWCSQGWRALGGNASALIKWVIVCVFAVVVIGLFGMMIHFTTWPGTEWLRNHERTLALQLTFAFAVVLASLSILVPHWRKALLGGTGLSFPLILGLLAII